MQFPFEIYRVPGTQALEKLAALQAAGNGYPIILGDAESFSRMAETIEMNDEQSIEELVAAAQAIAPASWFRSREEADPEYYEIDKGEWPDEDEDPGPNNRLSSHADVMTGEPYPEVFITVIPAQENWMVPCYMRIGGWNECPNAEEHGAIFKYWGDKYGARVTCITSDVIEFQVARPPATREEALLLAREQYVYCADIVQQGTETIEALAATLLNARVWFFWWD
jgi:hypothetical protein